MIGVVKDTGLDTDRQNDRRPCPTDSHFFVASHLGNKRMENVDRIGSLRRRSDRQQSRGTYLVKTPRLFRIEVADLVGPSFSSVH